MTTKFSLEDTLDGKDLGPDDTPHTLEKPCYRRDGLYGRTPFTPKPTAIHAVIVHSICRNCGNERDSFGGIFQVIHGRALHGETVFQNRIPSALQSDIKEIETVTEETPFCPECL